MELHYHLLSSYAQKTLIGLYEIGASFKPQTINFMDPNARAEYEAFYPIGKIPLLVLDDGTKLPESSIIIEHVDLTTPGGPRLMPADPARALRVRLLDRQVDNYLNDTFQRIFFDGRKPPEKRDPEGVAIARKRIEVMYHLLDAELARGPWLAGDSFSLADCAAAPCLSYLRGMIPFDAHKNLAAYASRLAERPSVQRVQQEAAPIVKAVLGG
jgi:glutathione S-transferase